jgi:hypothetical protein
VVVAVAVEFPVEFAEELEFDVVVGSTTGVAVDLP